MSEFRTPALVGPLKKRPSVPTDYGIEQNVSEKEEEKESVGKSSPAKPVKIPGALEISPSDRKKYEKIIADLKYREPKGSAPADSRYTLEVLKTGTILDNVKFETKRYFIVGRIPGCDILAEHPTVSRLHAIFQFIDGSKTKEEDEEDKKDDGNEVEVETQVRDKGLYLLDLNSTHGTYLNKNRLHPNRLYRLRVGHVVKFGNSSRLYIVCGPEDDEEEESEKTVTELLKERTEKELARKKAMAEMEDKTDVDGRNVEDDGITWGMAEDAEEESDMQENPFSMDFNSSELTLDNPKKTLRGWFEREGYDLEYDVREKSAGHFICRIELPLDRPGGGKVFAEVELKGKKKDVVLQCAMQACQILDKYGVLRQSHHESRFKKKNRDWEDQDYYSSDEDTFLDRTGTVEKKREKRMMEAGKIQPKIETYESLLEKSKELAEEISKLKDKIAKAEGNEGDDDEVDTLDAYMSDLKTGAGDVKKLKSKLRELTAEEQKNKKLLDIAKPAIAPVTSSKVIIPEPPTTPSEKPAQLLPKTQEDTLAESTEESGSSHPKKALPTIGTKIQFKVNPRKVLLPTTRPKETVEPVQVPFQTEEEDDDGNKGDDNSSKNVLSKPLADEKNSTSSTPVEILEEEVDDDDDDEIIETSGGSSTDKPRTRKRVRRRKQEVVKEAKYEYDPDDPKYSIWVPPSNQKGDGKTSLNEKLGY